MGKPGKICGRDSIHKNTKKINKPEHEHSPENDIGRYHRNSKNELEYEHPPEDDIDEEMKEAIDHFTEPLEFINIEQQMTEMSKSPYDEGNKINERNGSVPPSNPNNIKYSLPPKTNDAQFTPTSNKIKRYLLIIAIAVISYIFMFVAGNVDLSDKKGPISHIEKKICELNKLEQKYPLEENILWTTLQYGIQDITNNEYPDGPSVYLFLQNENSKAPFILTDIANLAASCFDSHSKPIILKEEDFDSNDYGVTIAKYINRINDGGVVVVLVHLNELPGKAARALHTICDKYSPIVKKAIILLSLKVNPDSKGRGIDIAENTLRDLWKSSLKNNELEPLIIRVSDTVFRLQS